MISLSLPDASLLNRKVSEMRGVFQRALSPLMNDNYVQLGVIRPIFVFA